MAWSTQPNAYIFAHPCWNRNRVFGRENCSFVAPELRVQRERKGGEGCSVTTVSKLANWRAKLGLLMLHCCLGCLLCGSWAAGWSETWTEVTPTQPGPWVGRFNGELRDSLETCLAKASRRPRPARSSVIINPLSTSAAKGVTDGRTGRAGAHCSVY